MITNGSEMFCYHYNSEIEKYEQIENLTMHFSL